MALPLAAAVAAATAAPGRWPQSFHAQALSTHGRCDVVEAGWGQENRLAAGRVVVTERWEWHECDMNEKMHGESHSKSKVLDFYGASAKAVWRRVREVCSQGVNTTVADAAPARMARLRAARDTEVRKIVDAGDSANRIDVVFMGDGYTQDERARFFEDMQRLTDDMFTDVTFQSYLPVFNIWAIHVASVESGIGTHSTPRNTPFQLYRQGTELRGVYIGNSQAARDTCALADGCEFPSVIGNDEYYGGLGGAFVIGTRSKTTGTVVLRHEMGHNFVDVGEEYDDGSVYRGVNSGTSATSSIKWAHWLTEPQQQVARQRAVQRIGAYPWQDLAAGRQSFSFTSDGAYRRWFLRFTVSGCPEEGSLRVFLDGRELAWAPTRPDGAEQPDGSTLDRQFYMYEDMAVGFTAGTHELAFESGFAPPTGRPIRQLCSISLNEYGNEDEFKMDQIGYVGAYPTWDVRGRETYRPTNEVCLMRNMSSPHFCPVCKEGMWHQMLARISLIDDVEVVTAGGQTTVTLKAIPLAQFRPSPVPGVTERYEVSWSQNGRQRRRLRDDFSFTLPADDAAGSWEASLEYITSEVRVDPNNLLKSTKSFEI